MKNRLCLLLFTLLCFAEVSAQTTQLQGKITNEEDIEGIHVLNNSSRNNSVTDAFGNFSIQAKVADTLVFSSVNYLPKKIEITEILLERGIVVVTLDKLINQLDEVFLGSRLTGNLETDIKNMPVKEKIDFWTLGIPGFQGEPEEKIVPAYTFYAPTALNVEALYNHLSGYYKMLRTKRKWEGENNTVARILYEYDEAFFLKSYQIPEHKLYDFILFCMETSTLQTDFTSGNYGKVLGTFKEKAPQYVSRLEITSEKKE
ncbi:hypothetical protein [Rasiella sp. SM2506]|uniref:hypothetical protein n=1 Tax=Rasiella sp. SM2506 TaxID=3423914 RepID=UPI003D79ADDC